MAKEIVGTWNDQTQKFDTAPKKCYCDGQKCPNPVAQSIMVKDSRRDICQQHYDELILILNRS